MQISLLNNQSAAAAPAILIIGPYAAKWFSDRQPEQEDEQINWIVVSEAEALPEIVGRLKAKKRRLYAFFPFFPDGEETAAQAMAQIAAWQSSLHQQEALPCVLALYARLSHESQAGQAKWSGKYDLSKTSETTLARELEKLLALPEPLSCHSIYRYAMMDALRLWLESSGIAKALQALFCGSSLRLSAVLLADNGNGFTRHGAWAQWLQQKFGLCPGLSPGIMLPDLPAITDPVTPYQPDRQRPGFSWRWLPVCSALLLAMLLIGSTWLEARSIDAATRTLADFRQTEERQLQKKRAVYQRLRDQKQQLIHCRDAWFSRLWRFSRCGQMAERVSDALQNYNPSPVFMASGSVALFARGSATLRPDSSKNLAWLLPLIQNNAQTTFAIVGHSDNTGSPETNYQLSIRRAEAVRDWLTSHAEVSPDRFVIKGMGDTLPVASNQTGEGRERNRRVEVIPLPDTANIKQVDYE
ncbi:OmpA family protein [Erwinia sp. 198]|uniref:OmpA family protein n=1 Tax=Erwinia sp. 198 TaxID=2022746 RepID=UPI000FB3C1F2|nr:OmpA family protein [Erwinia sp. 198]RRZ91669.1 hypothetical protein EGK14_12120 [Erwinia sp. 198]